MADSPTDLELVRAARADPAAYGALIQRYEARLSRYIHRLALLSRPEVEDILQTVFWQAYRHLNSFDDALPFGSWIYRLAHNATISHFRRQKARATEVELAEGDAAPLLAAATDLPTETDSNLLATRVRAVLQQLPPDYREVLVLRFLEDKSYAEISDILRRPLGTVAALISRAKAHFQKLAVRQNLTPTF